MSQNRMSTTYIITIIAVKFLARSLASSYYQYDYRPIFEQEVLNHSRFLGNKAPVVRRPDNFIRWIRHYTGPKIYFTLNVVQGFRTLPNLTLVRVCIFACTKENTEIFAQIETVG